MESILVQKRTRFDFEQIRIRPLNNINVNYLPFDKKILIREKVFLRFLG